MSKRIMITAHGRKATQFLLDALPIKERRCSYCDCKVSAKNFGGAIKGIICCVNIVCLFRFSEEIN